MTDNKDEDSETEKKVITPREMQFSFEIEIESPPRDVQRAFGMDRSVELGSDLLGFKDGDYRPCDYCEGDSIVHVDDYEDHLRDRHHIEP